MYNTNEILKLIRLDTKLTQKEFAERLNLKQSGYAMIESGKNNVSVELLKTVVDTFNINNEVFFKDYDKITIRDNLYINPNSKEVLKSSVNIPQNQKDYTKLLIEQSKEKNVNSLAHYYNNDPIGIQTKRLLDLKDKYTRRFNREVSKEESEVYEFSNLIDHLGDTIELVLDVYFENINTRPDPFEATQYFDRQNDTVNIPDTVDYTKYKESVLNWLKSIKHFEPVLKEFYTQSEAFLKNISAPEFQ